MIGVLELTGLGLSLEHPTVTEHTIKIAANRMALAFLLHAMEARVFTNVLTELRRFMVSPPAA
jgi:hypothetical protein